MKEKAPIFEIIIDGKIVKTIKGWKRLDNEDDKFNEKLYNLDFNREHSSSCGSHGFVLYFNEKTLKSTVWAWRELTGFVDKNGEKIYYGDYLRDEDGEEYSLNQYDDFNKHKNEYYIRSTSSPSFYMDSDHLITEDEIKEGYVVVHKVFPTVK